MTIHQNEDWIQMARLGEDDEIHFTPEYLALMRDLRWHAKAFAAHLITL